MIFGRAHGPPFCHSEAFESYVESAYPNGRFGPYADAGALQDPPFSVGALFHHPPIPHPVEIGRPIPAADHPLSNRPARRRSMHHPVIREPRTHVEVLPQPRPVSDDGLAVQLALFVEPRTRG
ncbi:MAG: hypothetical protein PCFJNLEI_04206 [Verrucomicrobiae bacterium]|nr:hypothetical protein [Verrucomicrobiae bacterium]